MKLAPNREMELIREAFPKLDFEFLEQQDEFKMLLESVNDTSEHFEDVCVIGTKLLRERDRHRKSVS